MSSTTVCCRLFLFLAVMALETACTKLSQPQLNVPADTDTIHTEQPPVDTAVPLQALELLNEHYGADSQQVMDIYLPAGRTPAITHIMVMIHGGGWMGGDKQDYTPHINNMKNRDARYAYVNLNYRLVKDGRNIFPATEEDINTALEYIWSRADSFHISPLTGLIGTSAGAHLAALQGCKHNQKGYIRSMVCIMGVYDMKRFYDEGSAGVMPLVELVLGGAPGQKEESYRSSSPLFYVSGHTPPVLLIHGTEDTLVRYSQAVAMDSALKKAGAVRELYSFKGWHAIPADVINEAAAKMFAHIDRYTK